MNYDVFFSLEVLVKDELCHSINAGFLPAGTGKTIRISQTGYRQLAYWQVTTILLRQAGDRRMPEWR